jgi:predicted metalloprotease with PDZ domain
MRFHCLLACAVMAVPTALARAQGNVTYTIQVTAPAEHRATVIAVFPNQGRNHLDLYLPVWSPGFYRVEHHAEQVLALAATDPDGHPLEVSRPKPDRWRIAGCRGDQVTVTYTLDCSRPSVTRNQVETGFAVFCGPATFLAVADAERRRCDVRLELPPEWPHVATGLPAVEGRPRQFTAPDYDALCDAPLVAGTIRMQPFTVFGVRHDLACFGAVSDWNVAQGARRLQPLCTELCRMFGTMPFERYVFLDGFRTANGCLEHRNSALLTTSSRQQPDDLIWLAAAGREYCQAFNGKRLRPIELGPFDYENPPSTSGLWIVEGFSVYLTDLACARCGAATQDQWLQAMSTSVRGLQSSPGRRLQSLAESSTTVWTSSLSGIGGDPHSTVSYLVKGPVVAFLLDARLRAASNGRRGLDELMQRAYARWSGETGFQPQEFEALASDLAGVSLRPFFARAVYSTEELDYREVLRWFGLRFRPVAEGAPASDRWTLDPLPEATAEQTAHLQGLLAPTVPPRPDPAPSGR